MKTLAVRMRSRPPIFSTSCSEIAVAATVPNSNDLLWSWQPREGQFLASPTFAFGSPDGSMALVSSQVDGTTVHTLISANGTLIAGFGTSEPVIPQGSFFSGWYDENSIAYTAPAADGLVVNVVSLETFTTSQVAAFAADQGLQQIWSVGDGQHLIAIGEPEAFLYEADASRRGRTLSRACDLSLRNGPVG